MMMIVVVTGGFVNREFSPLALELRGEPQPEVTQGY
jgi:hypothetical protein